MLDGSRYDVVRCEVRNESGDCHGVVVLKEPLPMTFSGDRQVELAGTCPDCGALYVKYDNGEIAFDA